MFRTGDDLELLVVYMTSLRLFRHRLGGFQSGNGL
jgi:hypothetical protein